MGTTATNDTTTTTGRREGYVVLVVGIGGEGGEAMGLRRRRRRPRRARAGIAGQRSGRGLPHLAGERETLLALYERAAAALPGAPIP
jgi:hypothetical protein